MLAPVCWLQVRSVISLTSLGWFSPQSRWPKLSTTGELLQLGALKQPVIEMFHEECRKETAGLRPNHKQVETSWQCELRLSSHGPINACCKSGFPFPKSGPFLPGMSSFPVWHTWYYLQTERHCRIWKLLTPFRVKQTLLVAAHTRRLKSSCPSASAHNPETIPGNPRHNECDPALLVLGKKRERGREGYRKEKEKELKSGPVNNTVHRFVP